MCVFLIFFDILVGRIVPAILNLKITIEIIVSSTSVLQLKGRHGGWLYLVDFANYKSF